MADKTKTDLLAFLTDKEENVKLEAVQQHIQFTKLDAEKVKLQAQARVGDAEANLKTAIRDAVSCRSFDGIVDAEVALENAKTKLANAEDVFSKYFG